MSLALPPPVIARPAAHLAAGAPVVSAALTETNVRVNSDFRGDRIVLYGAVFDPQARASDVVVSRLGADYLDWRRAVVRLKEADHLYDVADHGVRFVDKGLFRAEIALPAEAPIGQYDVRILLFQNGQPVSEKDRTLTVEKVGVERGLYLWAHRGPWSYGLAAMAFALSAGWAASTAFRRD